MDPLPDDNVAKPRSTREDAVDVVRRLRDGGHVAYFAGGCVRDMLLGRQPKDYDVATDAPPPRVRELFPNTQAVGAAFGVILVRTRRSMIEVATFRADGEYKDGRHPDGVRFTTAEEDAKRRDFTINGLFLDPLEGDGRVLDFVGGRDDLSARVIRAIGDPQRRFEEDHLRLLRAVRFAARFGFELEPETAAAIRAHAPHLRRISPERIAEELRVMLTPTTRDFAWQTLRTLGLTREVFRHLADVPVGTGLSRPRDVFRAVCKEEPITFGLALAAAAVSFRIEQLGGPEHPAAADPLPGVARALRQGLKISNDEAADVTDTLEGFSLAACGRVATLAQKKRFLHRPFAKHSRALLLAFASLVDGGHAVIEALEVELRKLETTEFAPPPVLTGDDLTAAGQKPGPAYKRVLEAVYDAQLEDRVLTKEAALAMGLSMLCDGA